MRAIDALDKWESTFTWDSWCDEHKDEPEKFHITPPSSVIAGLPHAGSERKWISCAPSELPKDKTLWVTHDNGLCRYVEKVFYDMTEWSESVSDVVAYMPYEEPEPYEGKRE